MTLLQTLLLFGCFVLVFFFLSDAAVNLWGNTGDRGEQRVKRRLGGVRAAIPASQHIKRKPQAAQGFFLNSYYQDLLEKSDSPISLKRLYFIIAAITFCLTAVFYFFLPVIPVLAALAISLVVGFGFPVMTLKGQIQKRNFLFEEQFPDALELIVRSLRIGQPLNTAIKAVADEMPDPVGKEYSLVAQEIAYGKDLPIAIEDMLKRITVHDLRFFVVAIQIQHESGGNLAEILEGLSKIIRGRSRLMRKVKALTIEGRFSAWFLSIFPILMIFVMSMVNPGYYQKVMSYPFFWHLVGVTVAMLTVNVAAMRIITKIKV